MRHADPGHLGAARDDRRDRHTERRAAGVIVAGVILPHPPIITAEYASRRGDEVDTTIAAVERACEWLAPRKAIFSLGPWASPAAGKAAIRSRRVIKGPSIIVQPPLVGTTSW